MIELTTQRDTKTTVPKDWDRMVVDRRLSHRAEFQRLLRQRLRTNAVDPQVP